MDARRIVAWVLLVGGGILLLVGLLPIFGKILGYQLAGSIVGEIKLATDINPYAEKALLAALGAVAAAIYVKFNLSLSWNRQLMGAGLIAALWVSVYGYMAWSTSDLIDGPWFTTKGEPLRCYVLESQRVRLLYIVERDPRTGAVCRPVTEGMQPKLREWLLAQRDATQRGEHLTLKPVRSPSAFFGFAGDPLIWYYRNDDGTCEYYDIPGFHPRYQEELKPITRQASAACETALAAAQKSAETERKRAQDREQAAARKQAQADELQARADEFRERYQRYVGAPVLRNSALVATADLGALAASAVEVIRERGHTVLLKPAFTSDGLFESVWNGGGELASLGVDAARSVVLLRTASAPHVTRTAALQGFTFARQEFAVLLIRPADAFAAQQHAFVAEGRAFDDAQAQAALRADFTAKLRALILQKL